MLLTRGHFIGPLQEIKLGDSCIKQVKITRCVGVEIDSQLKWNIHVNELIRSFTQKLNLLRSLYFLPTKVRADFYFKIILPSVTYGLVIWGSCGKTLLSELERIHVRAAKLIYGMDWYTPSEEVLARAEWTTIGHMYSQDAVASL